MPNKFGNRIQVTTSTTGTGTLTLGSAVSGYQGFFPGGIANGATVSYLLQEGNAWEIGTGTYTSAGTTLTRSLGQSSTGSLLNLAGAGVVSVIVQASDLPPPLRFPATQVDDADPNALDDYEEGTWTPAVTGAGTPGTFTYTTQDGVYTKIGRLVQLHFNIVVSATSVAPTGGSVGITGVPYNVSFGSPKLGIPVTHMIGITMTAGYSLLVACPLTSSLNLQQTGPNVSSVGLGAGAFGSSFTIRGSGIYYIG